MGMRADVPPHQPARLAQIQTESRCVETTERAHTHRLSPCKVHSPLAPRCACGTGWPGTQPGLVGHGKTRKEKDGSEGSMPIGSAQRALSSSVPGELPASVAAVMATMLDVRTSWLRSRGGGGTRANRHTFLRTEFLCWRSDDTFVLEE